MTNTFRIACLIVFILAAVALAAQADESDRPVYRIHLDDLSVKFPVSGSGQVAVRAEDRRAIVTTGMRPAEFVGLVKDLLGRSSTVVTYDGKSVADHLAKSIVATLSAKGFEAAPVYKLENSDPAAAPAVRTLVLTVDLLRSESIRKVWLYFDLTVRVLDEQGQDLAQSSLSAAEMIGKAGDTNEAMALVRQALAEKLTKLLDQQYIVKSLKQTEN